VSSDFCGFHCCGSTRCRHGGAAQAKKKRNPNDCCGSTSVGNPLGVLRKASVVSYVGGTEEVGSMRLDCLSATRCGYCANEREKKGERSLQTTTSNNRRGGVLQWTMRLEATRYGCCANQRRKEKKGGETVVLVTGTVGALRQPMSLVTVCWRRAREGDSARLIGFKAGLGCSEFPQDNRRATNKTERGLARGEP